MKNKQINIDPNKGIVLSVDNVEIVNNNTGEVQEYQVYTTVKKRRVINEKFSMITQDVMKLICEKIQPISAHILMYFISISEYDNYIDIPQKDLAEKLKCSERQIKRGIKELVDLSIIIKQTSKHDSRGKAYIINPRSAWKGTDTARAKKLKEHKKDVDNLYGQLEFQFDFKSKQLPVNENFDNEKFLP